MLFPSKIIQGETIKNTLYYSEYSASEWDLTVYIVGNVVLTVDATNENGSFELTIDTSTLSAGNYSYQIKVSNGSETYNLENGSFKAEADLSEIDEATDIRSHAQKMLDLIESVLEGRATNEQKRIKINNREIEHHSFEELTKLRDYYKAEISRYNVKRKKLFKNIGYRF